MSSLDFTRWRAFIKVVYNFDYLKLPTSLSRWVNSTSASIQTWDWFCSTDSQFLFHHSNSTWHRHLIKSNSHHQYFKESLLLSTSPSSTVYPASIISTNSSHILHSCSTNPPPTIPPDPVLNYRPFTFSDIGQSYFFDNISHSPSLDNLHHHVCKGTALAVSDGSYYPHYNLGGCGWIVSTPDMSEWFQGGCIIPGNRSMHSAYCTELSGLVGLSFFFSSLCTPPPTQLSQEITSDCKLGLFKLTFLQNLLKLPPNTKI